MAIATSKLSQGNQTLLEPKRSRQVRQCTLELNRQHVEVKHEETPKTERR